MDQEIQALKNEVSELKAIVVENNTLLTKINHRSRFTFIANALKWTVIIGASIGAFYYVQPFLDAMLGLYSSIGGTDSSMKDINQVLDQYLPR